MSGSTTSTTPLPPSLTNMEFLPTSNVSIILDDGNSPRGGSAIFVRQFSDSIMGTRLDAQIEVVKADSYLGKLILHFIAYARVDVVLARPANFVVLDGVTLS
jgi:hypothetical protein